VDNSTSLSIDACLQDEKHVQALLDVLLDPHRSLPEIIQKDLITIKGYISGGQVFEEFCKGG
jgi:hypothetical protein